MSNKKLEALTPTQEKALSRYRDQWLGIGLQAGKPLPPKQRLLELFTAVYAEAGLSPPSEIIIVDSPLAGRNLTGDSAHGWGTMDAGWLSFYAFFLGETGVTGPSRLVPLMNLTKEAVGWYWVYENAVIVSPIPSEIHRNRQGALHRYGGPALSYPDGFSVYCLNGVRFTGDMIPWVTKPIPELDSSAVLSIRNVEQRAEVIKRFGVAQFLEKLGPRIIDSSTEHGYQLLGVTLGNYPERRYLRMLNPSVPGEIHIEAVHPECTTVTTALQWRNFGNAEGGWVAPQVLT